jgi:hypothetical protein
MTGEPHRVDPAVLERIEAVIVSSLYPVRPIANRWILSSALVVVVSAVALLGGAAAGFEGFQQMDGWTRGLVFPALLLLAVLSGSSYAGVMIPGSRRVLSPALVLFLSCTVMASVFAATFRDYGTQAFVAQGVDCLKAGVTHAVPAAAAGWLVLRRGWAIDRTGAGIAAGTLAGLAGLGLLELHCPSGQVFHVLVWHVGVVASCAAAGMSVARIAS